MIKRLAIIPARGGSKRIKNKNLKKIKGKPLIKYTLMTAKKSKLFEKIHVSTESLKIHRYLSNLGFSQDFLRDNNLAGDNIPISKVISYVVEKYKKQGKVFDEIWLMYATNPFVNVKHLKRAYKIYKNKKCKRSIISVCKYNLPLEWSLSFNKKEDRILPTFKKKIRQNSNSFNNFYCDAGMFVIYQKGFIYNNGESKNIYFPYEIPWWETVDIDDIEDLNAAKQLIKNVNI